MQFKVIASVLLFFVAQTMALAAADPHPTTVSCTFTFYSFALKMKTNHSIFVVTAGRKGSVDVS